MTRRVGNNNVDVDKPFVLEAHYYDGGLRVKPLGDGRARPAWVPPSDYVGFRNEIALEGDDAVVEFARFEYKGRRITWIGVFHRSVDQVFGDRKNQAGVGVWLFETDVVDAVHLLDGLQQFAAAVAEGKVDKIVDDAEVFAGEKYLQSYLRWTKSLPDQLSGWPFCATAMPESTLFLAGGRDSSEAWEAAAEQILRMSLLPAPADTCSRALVLVRVSVKSGREKVGADLEPVRKGALTELLGLLPSAIGDISDQNRTLRNSAESLSEKLDASESALSEACLANENLKQRISELEKHLEENDTLKKLSSIDTALKGLVERTTRVEKSLGAIAAKPASSPFIVQHHPINNPDPFAKTGQYNDAGLSSTYRSSNRLSPYVAIPILFALFVMTILAVLLKTRDESLQTATDQISQQADDQSTDQLGEPAVRAIDEQRIAALQARDAVRVAALYSEGAMVMNAGLRVANGREAIRAKIEQDLKDRSFMIELSPSEARVGGDLGYARGRYRVTRARGREEGSYLIVLNRDSDGQWQIIEDITAPGRPAAAEDGQGPSGEPASSVDPTVAPATEPRAP